MCCPRPTATHHAAARGRQAEAASQQVRGGGARAGHHLTRRAGPAKPPLVTSHDVRPRVGARTHAPAVRGLQRPPGRPFTGLGGATPYKDVHAMHGAHTPYKDTPYKDARHAPGAPSSRSGCGGRSALAGAWLPSRRPPRPAPAGSWGSCRSWRARRESHTRGLQRAAWSCGAAWRRCRQRPCRPIRLPAVREGSGLSRRPKGLCRAGQAACRGGPSGNERWGATGSLAWVSRGAGPRARGLYASEPAAAGCRGQSRGIR
jgi:hypothetical protein